MSKQGSNREFAIQAGAVVAFLLGLIWTTVQISTNYYQAKIGLLSGQLEISEKAIQACESRFDSLTSPTKDRFPSLPYHEDTLSVPVDNWWLHDGYMGLSLSRNVNSRSFQGLVPEGYIWVRTTFPLSKLPALERAVRIGASYEYTVGDRSLYLMLHETGIGRDSIILRIYELNPLHP